MRISILRRTIYPVLTPMAVDSSRPFPLIRNKTLNIGALISEKGRKGQSWNLQRYRYRRYCRGLSGFRTDRTGKSV